MSPHNHPHGSPELRQSAAVRITLIGALLDLTLGILKILAGLMANSVALVSDGIHSLSDLLTDGFVLLMARISHQAPDKSHPYGHGRFETLGTMAISIALFMVAGAIFYDSIRRLGDEELLVAPGWLAFVITLISIASKEWIYQWTRRVAKRINSSMLLANAWHSRTDALSSVVVLVGLAGVWLGYPWMDLVAAMLVALMIARIAWTLIADSLKELVDTAMPEEEVEHIRSHILEHRGIKGVHDLRSRMHGSQVLLDIHVQVDSRISVSEGHYLGDHISQSLKKSFPQVSDIVIHIDPELDDDHSNPRLPLRPEVEAILLQRWQGLLSPDQLEGLTLHYLKQRIYADIYLDKSLLNKELTESLKEKSKDLEWLQSLRFYGCF